MDEEGNVWIYLDGDHAVYYDGKGNSWLFLSMGKGEMINSSKNLGLFTTSSIETEIVSCSERFLKCSWFR